MSETRQPLATIVLTCFNHEGFVVEALDAVRGQSYRPIQLIVTDDASVDQSAARIEQWLAAHWPHAAYLRHTENKGLCRTLNEALDLVEGDYVSFASADDWMEPDRVARLVHAFEELPDEVGLVHSGIRLVDASGAELHVSMADPGTAPTGWVYHQQLAMQTIPTPAAMVRRSVFDVVGRFTEGDLVEDYDMWLRVTRSFRVEHIPGALVNFRWHAGNTTTRIYGEPYDQYVATCLRRQLGHSDQADQIIQRRLASLAMPHQTPGRT